MSKLEVDKIDPQSGTDLELGTSGDTITIPAGVTFDSSAATNTLPSTVVTTTGTQTLTNKSIATTQLTGTITPSDGTVTLAKLTATGTQDATTFLRGDNTFAEAGGGKILQVVSTAYPNAGQTTITSDSYTFIEGYSVEITPSSTSSKIYVTGSAHFDSGGNGNEIGLAIYRYKDGTYTNPISYASDYGQTSDSSRENKTVPAWPYIDSPNTTETLYYAFYAKTSTGDTIYLNRKTCNITVMEIGA